MANRARLFPAPGSGQASAAWQVVEVTTRPINPELYRTSSGRRQIEQLLAAGLGDRIAKLFYQHVPNEVGSRLQSR